ncbi:hypothetical protein K435DRAFT_783082 [Dendrothele bispora CBS 962.96]|uniref:Uncharacterized protein n=1 Tax=Dendrothele bispora (strain CBS 962.96) TaxID=1314807 RepID=A0A4S8LAU5_DENBC|nr:hypothetical protein K435DRAFT_783082 [Dendrothele bispora CBS 962.96]
MYNLSARLQYTDNVDMSDRKIFHPSINPYDHSASTTVSSRPSLLQAQANPPSSHAPSRQPASHSYKRNGDSSPMIDNRSHTWCRRNVPVLFRLAQSPYGVVHTVGDPLGFWFADIVLVTICFVDNLS